MRTVSRQVPGRTFNGEILTGAGVPPSQALIFDSHVCSQLVPNTSRTGQHESGPFRPYCIAERELWKKNKKKTNWISDLTA